MGVEIEKDKMVRDLAELYIDRRLTLDEFLDHMLVFFCDIVERKKIEDQNHGA